MPVPIYLDYAAATPVRPEVAAAMAPFAVNQFYNPSSVYLAARSVRAALEAARSDCAQVLGAKPGEITFTAGSTESINMALAGVLKSYPKGRVLLAAGEHTAVVRAAEGFAPGRVDYVPLSANGRAEAAAIKAALKAETVVVSVAYANSETGAVAPLARLAREVAAIRRQRSSTGRPLLLHSDASAAASLPLKVSRLGVDLLTLSGSKIYGPKGSGLLYVRSGLKLAPLIHGGGQEGGRRGGTENVGAIVGLATALKLIQEEAAWENQRLSVLRDRLEQKLLAVAGVSGLNLKQRLPSLLTLLTPVSDGERLVMELDEAGLQAGTGAACSANFEEPSRALLALGLSAVDANRSLRLSLGRGTTQSQIDRAGRIIATVLQK